MYIMRNYYQHNRENWNSKIFRLTNKSNPYIPDLYVTAHAIERKIQIITL